MNVQGRRVEWTFPQFSLPEPRIWSGTSGGFSSKYGAHAVTRDTRADTTPSVLDGRRLQSWIRPRSRTGSSHSEGTKSGRREGATETRPGTRNGGSRTVDQSPQTQRTRCHRPNCERRGIRPLLRVAWCKGSARASPPCALDASSFKLGYREDNDDSRCDGGCSSRRRRHV